MNELLPIRWTGYPVYPSDPPDDFDRDPCVWYWYKDPADIPAAASGERYGSEESAVGGRLSDRPRVRGARPPSMPIAWPVT